MKVITPITVKGLQRLSLNLIQGSDKRSPLTVQLRRYNNYIDLWKLVWTSRIPTNSLFHCFQKQRIHDAKMFVRSLYEKKEEFQMSNWWKSTVKDKQWCSDCSYLQGNEHNYAFAGKGTYTSVVQPVELAVCHCAVVLIHSVNGKIRLTTLVYFCTLFTRSKYINQRIRPIRTNGYRTR